MPRKVFVAGEILTASDVNTNLADQAVMTFAGTAARGSAIGTAVEGMVTYLEDTDQLEVYGGTAVGWSSASNFLFGTATPTEGQVATFSTAVSGYVPADAPSGKVLQVVQATTTTQKSISTTSYTTTNATISITPSSSSSKVLIIASLEGLFISASTGSTRSANVELLRDATQVQEWLRVMGSKVSSSGETYISQSSLTYLDSPATTSSLTYTFNAKLESASDEVRFQFGGAGSTVLALEIAG